MAVAYVQTSQIVHSKYVEFFVYQLHLNKAVKKKKEASWSDWHGMEKELGTSMADYLLKSGIYLNSGEMWMRLGQ